MRFIDADALIETIRKYGVYGSGFDDVERENDVIDTIESQPTIEAVPVVHGTVITHTDKWAVKEKKCSVCGEFLEWGEYTKYCPECGAKLDGKKV